MLVCFLDGLVFCFGFFYLILYFEVNKWSIYIFGGNQDDFIWKCIGFWKYLDFIFLFVLEKLKKEGIVLGNYELVVKEFLDLLKLGNMRLVRIGKLSNVLDSYVEVQIYGLVSLREDVEKLVVDCFLYGMELEDMLVKLVVEYELELEWYEGYSVRVEELFVEFRGYIIDCLLDWIVFDGEFIVVKIGIVFNLFYEYFDFWFEWGVGGEGLMYFCRVWYVFVYYGQFVLSLGKK